MEIIFLSKKKDANTMRTNAIADNYDKTIDLVVAIGQFDGVHIAHQQLIKRVKTIANEKKLKSGIITFHPHPDFILKKRNQDTYLTPLKEKIDVIKQFDVDYLFVIDFNEEIAKMSPREFVGTYLLGLGVKVVVCGYDFRYGARGAGNANTLKSDADNLLGVEVISQISYHDEKVGSSLIRELLQKGKVEEVYQILGRFYQISGTVVSGTKIGRSLDIPTANLQVREEFADVLPGVYGVIVTVNNQRYMGLCNLGHSPSFNYHQSMRLETHIIGFNEDIYGYTITIDFVIRLRDEQKFSSKEAFVEQIKRDKEEVLTKLKHLL